MFIDGELPQRVDGAAERRARAVCRPDRAASAGSTASCGSTRTPRNTSISARPAARAAARVGLLHRRHVALEAELHAEPRPALRAAATVLPRNNSYSFATIEDVCGTVGRRHRTAAAICSSQGRSRASHGVFSQFNEGRSCVQHRPEQLRAEHWLRLDPRRRAPGCSARSSAARKATASFAPATRSATTARACRTSPTAIDDNPAISQTANRNNTLGNLGHARVRSCCRNRADLGPPAFAPRASIR